MVDKVFFENKKEQVFRGRTVGEVSFWSYLLDMYTFPEIVELRSPVVGKQGILQDAEHIKSYFTKSVGASLSASREI